MVMKLSRKKKMRKKKSHRQMKKRRKKKSHRQMKKRNLRRKPKKIRRKPSNYVKIRTVKDIHLIGMMKKILKILIKRGSGKNVTYVMDTLMMMDLVIYYSCKKNQIIKKLNVIYVEKVKI